MGEYLSPKQVSEVYHIAVPTLRLWRWRRRHNVPGEKGPEFLVAGAKKIIYETAAVERWLRHVAEDRHEQE